MQGWYSICKSINVIHHMNKIKDKNHMIIWIDAEETFWYNPAPTYDQNSQQSGKSRKTPKHNKVHIWQTHCQHHAKWAKTTKVPLRLGTRQGCSLLPLLFNIVLEVLATAIRQKEEIKGIQIGEEEVKLSLFADDMIVYIGWVQQGSRREN